MPSLRGNGLRDIEVSPKRTSLFNVFSKGLDPSVESDALQLKAVLQGYASGAFTDEQMEKFLEKNPAAKPFIAGAEPARARLEIGQKYFNPGSPAVTPFEGDFAGKGALLPKDAVAPKEDVKGAFREAMSRGDIEFAEKLQKLTPGANPTNQMTSVHLAVRAKGGNTGNPNIDALMPEKAQEILKNIQPFFSYEATDPEGGQTRVFGPRSEFLGQQGPNVKTVKSGQSQPEKSAIDQRGARGVIAQARGLVNQLWVAEGNVGSRAKQAAELKLKQLTQSDPRVAQYDSLREGFLAPIIRALGEKGTLAEGDIGRARELWPAFTDSKEVANAKLNQVENIFDGILTGKFNSLEEAISAMKTPPKPNSKPTSKPTTKPNNRSEREAAALKALRGQ